MLKGFLDKVISGIKMGDEDDFYDDDDEMEEEDYDDEESSDEKDFLEDQPSSRGGNKKSLFGSLSSSTASSRKESRIDDEEEDEPSFGSDKKADSLDDEFESSRSKDKGSNRFNSKDRTSSSYRSDSSANRGNGKIAHLHTRKGYGESSVCILKPSNIEEASEIGDHLQNNDIVILHVEGIDTDNAQRIVDFAAGCVYALEARLNRVSDFFFVLTPQSVVVSGDTTTNPTKQLVANVRSEY